MVSHVCFNSLTYYHKTLTTMLCVLHAIASEEQKISVMVHDRHSYARWQYETHRHHCIYGFIIIMKYAANFTLYEAQMSVFSDIFLKQGEKKVVIGSVSAVKCTCMKRNQNMMSSFLIRFCSCHVQLFLLLFISFVFFLFRILRQASTKLNQITCCAKICDTKIY